MASRSLRAVWLRRTRRSVIGRIAGFQPTPNIGENLLLRNDPACLQVAFALHHQLQHNECSLTRLVLLVVLDQGARPFWVKTSVAGSARIWSSNRLASALNSLRLRIDSLIEMPLFGRSLNLRQDASPSPGRQPS